MKKIIIIILVIFLVFFVAMLFTFNNKDTEFTVDLEANYIWLDEENIPQKNKQNEWVCFRKDFNLNSLNNTKDAKAVIAADSKYWLYINGETVVEEGSLKRTENSTTYFDVIDIGKYLKKGKNVISVLVWHFGKTGFSHIDSGQGMLLFQAQIGNEKILSNKSWKVLKHPAYIQNDFTMVNSIRLSEYNIFYNSNKEIDWLNKNYDDSNWENAKEYASSKESTSIWGTLIERTIPQFKFSKIKDYENSSDYKHYVANEDTILQMKLPHNMQIIPYFKIKSEANLQIRIDPNTDYNIDGGGHETYYITKNGIQEFESLAWINGETITYYIPKGVEILELGYRETGYDAEFAGTFNSNDDFFNNLWKMAQNTLYVNMRDTYIDCPDRERALWIADASIEMEEAIYSLDTSANALYERCIRSFVNTNSNNIFYSVIPNVLANYQLPIQNLLAISSLNDYYNYTGHNEILEYSYDTIKNYLNNWTLAPNSSSLLSTNSNYEKDLWKWYDAEDENIDIAKTNDTEIAETFWYYYALNSFCEISKALNKNDDYNIFNQKCNDLKQLINTNLWDGTGYKSTSFNGYDPKINSIAIISGIADESKYESISNLLINNYDSSTIMEKYIMQALCISGKSKEVQERIKTRYNDMVNNNIGTTTLWEYWNINQTNATTNHAWSGSPLIIMSKYFAGISPLTPGYNKILIKPQFGNLSNINAEVSTLKGKISVKAKKTDTKLELVVNVPKKTKIGIEKIKNSNELTITSGLSKIYSNGTSKDTSNIKYDSEDEKYIYFYITPGRYKFIAK